MTNGINVDIGKAHSCYVAATQSIESLLSIYRQNCRTSTKIVSADVNLSSASSEILNLQVFTTRMLFLLHVAFQKMTGRNYSLIYTLQNGSDGCNSLSPMLLQIPDGSTCQSVLDNITQFLDNMNEKKYENIRNDKLISSSAKVIIAQEIDHDIYSEIDDVALLFQISRRQKGFALCVSYHEGVYSTDFIEAVVSSLLNLEETAFLAPDMYISDLCLTRDFTRLSGIQVPVKDFIQQFYTIPSGSEDKIAVIQFCQNSFNPLSENVHTEGMTYGQLHRLSDRLSIEILQNSQDKDKIVSICVRDRRLLVASVLAVIKSGRPFSCILPLFPNNLKKQIVENNASELLLCDSSFSFGGVKTITVDTSKLAGGSPLNFSDLKGKSEIAYAVQTSGTTGTPKRVTVKRSSLNNYLSWRNTHYPISSKDITLILLNENSDAFLGSLLPALLAESTILIGELTDQRNYEAIAKIQAAFNVTNFSATPRMLQALLQSGNCDQFQYIQSIIVGGESSDPSLFDLVSEKCPDCARLIHEYGLTETTITCCANTDWSKKHSKCIGTPIQNTEIFIMDNDKKPMPAYLPGMIFVGGTCVASVDNDNNCEGMFNTLDVGYYDKDGLIYFVGRRRNDYKINGVRFNEEEIRSILLKQPGVDEVVSFLADNGNHQRVIVYVTGKNSLNSQDLSRKLNEELYLQHIPVTLLCVDKLPTDLNEKLGAQELYAKSANVPELSGYNSIKDKVRYYWGQALNLQEFDDKKTFFELGGNSILLTKMYKEIQAEQNWEKLKMIDFFKFPTIDSLAEYIKTLGYS